MGAALVLGAGGLLGSEVLTACRSEGSTTQDTSRVFQWDRPDTLAVEAQHQADEALMGASESLQVYWCAGSGYVGSSVSDLQSATAALRAVLAGLEVVANRGVRVHITYASSAGAVWSGATDMPLSESSPPAAANSYGVVKLAEEELVRTWAASGGRTATIARISNLFGRKQNQEKNQGLLTKLVVSTITGQPTVLFVPLDTCRDYLPASTAAAMLVADAKGELLRSSDGVDGTQIRLVASERAYTIAQVCGILQRMRRRRVPLVHVVTDATHDQPLRLTFRSERPSLGIRVPTLEESISRLFADESRRLAVSR